ncbi:MAG: universal stress protein [Desulfobacterales bacterium]|nr:universal stress protein [Desulfobacterales bacterium]
MDKKILIAFDDSENAKRAVEYVAKCFNPNTKITLFSVIPDSSTICDMESPELIPYFKAEKSNFCLLEDKKKDLVKKALQVAKEILLDAGFDEQNIILKIEPKKQGIARDIVSEARAGYNTIIMGRRGLSAIKEFFLGSVSSKVLSLAKDMSVMVVD